jgi:hypothetical protein
MYVLLDILQYALVPGFGTSPKMPERATPSAQSYWDARQNADSRCCNAYTYLLATSTKHLIHNLEREIWIYKRPNLSLGELNSSIQGLARRTAVRNTVGEKMARFEGRTYITGCSTS